LVGFVLCSKLAASQSILVMMRLRWGLEIFFSGRVCFGCDRLSIFGICEHGQNAPLPYSLYPRYFRCVTAIDEVSFLVTFVVAATHPATILDGSYSHN
jgi:hypothetical protein